MDQQPAPPRDRLRRRQAGRRLIKVGLAFVAAVLVVDALVGDRGLMETFRARRRHQELRGTIDELKRENSRMRTEAKRLREDPLKIEEVARRELGLIRPGEILVIVRDVPPAKGN